MYDTRHIEDGDDGFDVIVVAADRPTHTVLFSVGGGGDPARHLPLIRALADGGAVVAAPHLPRLASPMPTADELRLRAHRLSRGIDLVAPSHASVVGVGHSIGATMLLALAGGEVWLGPGQQLPSTPDTRVQRLALLAPATRFFGAPGALDAVHTPILAWAGTADHITPPPQAALLRDTLGERGVPVELRVSEGAGHFSFMHVPPPHVDEPLADREAFLETLTAEVCRFALRPPLG